MKIQMLIIAVLFIIGCEQAAKEPTINGRWYTQSQVEAGKTLFSKNCSSCHGEKAQGIVSNWSQRLPDGSYPPPPLNGTAHAWHHQKSVLSRVISEGGVRLGGKMPPFKGKLNEEEKDSIIAFFQNYWSGEVYKAWLERGGLN